MRQAVWAEGYLTRPLVLHADNGSPMKGATMKATLERDLAREGSGHWPERPGRGGGAAGAAKKRRGDLGDGADA